METLQINKMKQDQEAGDKKKKRKCGKNTADSLRIIRKIRSSQGKKHTKKNLRNIVIHLPSLPTKHIQNNVHIFHLMCT